uniref:Proprotein convertase subtilisin/kexin type 9 n=1 Tax=Knipowitschia caucasica TaxID=637954 RepID=A0AAV2KY16_KNICA
MRLFSVGLALCLCASLAVSAQDEEVLDFIREDGTETGAEASAEFLRSNKASWRMPGQYVVVLREGSREAHVQRTIRRLRAKATRSGALAEIQHTYSGALHGFLVHMSSDLLPMAVKLPHVHYIEEDSSIFAQSAPWHLQKILQPYGGPSENGTYRPPNDGGRAQVYLMDGSVDTSHREIQGRVLVTDFNHVPEEDGARVHRQASQCDSHGTHVAGVVGGVDSGVARGAAVNLVRVLNCQGKGTVSGALAGLEYIRASLMARPLDAVVVLLPFVAGFSRSLNAVCREMVSSGAVLIAAAGNYREDACLYSPASEPEVITVGAVNSVDQLMSQGAGGSNFGPCVDLFAPGDDIVSASSDCSTCFSSRSGTSQAAAHVAGIAAVILSANQKASPVQLLHSVLHFSVSNRISLFSVPDPLRLPTPNLITAMPPGTAAAHAELLCRSVWSERSGVRAVSRCRHGEEMMGCSSYSPDGGHFGETIDKSSGQMECVAHSGAAGEGVFAVARCCVIDGLQCHIHSGVKPGQDAECEGQESRLTGCTSRSSALVSGSRPHTEHRRCSAPEGGAASALCCRASDLECQVLQQTTAAAAAGAAAGQVEASCPAGWTLTDCNAVSRGSILGAVSKEGVASTPVPHAVSSKHLQSFVTTRY